MNKITIYDTLSGEEKELTPIVPGKIKMYVCGPTIYNLIHIGNARPMIIFDSFRRFLEYSGYEVTMVQNFTDIDDKIINKANSENVSCDEISERYINEFWKDSELLNIRAPNFSPKTTNYVDNIIKFTEELIKKGFAYQSGGDVYFRVRKFDKYGELSHRNIEDMRSGSRIEISDIKEDPLDFALWKNAKEGEPYWESPWGKGRPGWHIECSVMSTELLGKEFDIHAGGNDLIFPHHENERAQSIALHGTNFANYWMHNGMIKVSGDKMSKSIGNIWLVREVIKKYGPDTLKIFVLSKHYRSPIDFNEEGLEAQKKSVDRVQESLLSAEEFFGGNVPFVKHSENYEKEKEYIKNSLSVDFNTPKATAKIFDYSREINKAITDKDEKAVAEYYYLIKNEIGSIFGLFLSTSEKKGNKTDDIMKIVTELRTVLKKNKNYELSDFIRNKLGEIGIEIKDTPTGTEYRIK